MTITPTIGPSLISIQTGSNGFEQCYLVEWLFHQAEVRPENRLLLKDGLSVTGHEQDADARPEQPHLISDGRALHRRHDDVGEKKVDLAAVAFGDLHGLGAARRHEHGVAISREYAPSHLTQCFLVVNHENRLGRDVGPFDANINIRRVRNYVWSRRG